MNPDPFTDGLSFLTRVGWPTVIFWLLLTCSIGIAAFAYRTIPGQNTFAHFSNWGVRLLIDSMWWQQSVWKLPPYYTDQPNEPFGDTGLAYWMGLMVKHAAIPLQSEFVNNIVLPHFHLFAPLVYAAEVGVAVSLILGLLVRLGGFIGALQIMNIWLGLYSAPGEWPWTYFFLLLLMLSFALHHYGRSLGVDAILLNRFGERRTLGRILLVEAA
jgi:uncharacterized membrane protein YphA (DoxX/SURF4 family)